MVIKKSSENSIKQAAEMLKNGGVLIIPTDTVYGFSGIADICLPFPKESPAGSLTSTASYSGPSYDKLYKTDEKIRHIKGREENKPLIQLIGKPSDISLYTDVNIPSHLLEKWPGPLTIIVPIKTPSPYKIPENFKTVAFRCPGDKWLRDLIIETGAPIFSTSVNRSGFPVLDSIEEIKKEFGQETDIIIDDGDKKGGIPSTLVSILNGEIKVLRQGSVQI